MKYFLTILLAFLLTTTIAAESVMVDGIQYELDTTSHVASVLSTQCFESPHVAVPYHIDVNATDYRVAISNTDFSAWACNVNSLMSITVAEGHRHFGSCLFILINLKELSLPSTMTELYTSFVTFPNLRKLVCHAVTPPVVRPSSNLLQAYDSAIVYVPAESVEAYRAHPNWGKFAQIMPLSEQPDRHVVVDGIEYVLDAVAHIAKICSEQSFPAPHLAVPYHIEVDSTTYTVAIYDTDFFLWQSNADSLQTLTIAGGHTQMATQSRISRLQELSLPATLLNMHNHFGLFPHLRQVVCAAVTPPSVLDVPSQFPTSAYDSAILYVPAEALDAYHLHRVWGKFRHLDFFGRFKKDGLFYDLDRESRIASLCSDQCFRGNVVVPYYVMVDTAGYAVSIANTDFAQDECDSLVSLCLAEGHTQMPSLSASLTHLQRLSLPSTLTSFNADLRHIPNLRYFECRATTPPAIAAQADSLPLFASATLWVPAEAYRSYKGHPFWGRFRNISMLNTVMCEVTDTLYYHNTLQYAVSDSLHTAILFGLAQPVLGQGLILTDSVLCHGAKYPVSCIADSALTALSGIRYIEAPARAPRCGKGTFYGCNRDAILVIVPHDSCVAGYRADAEWNRFPNIVTRLQPGDTIRQNCYHTTPNYQLFYKVQPDQRTVHLVRRSGGYLVKPAKAVDLPADIHDALAIPYKLTALGDSVLAGCADLTSVTIPASVQHIGQGMATGCTKLLTWSVDPANPSYYSPNQTNGIVRRSDNMLLYAGINTRLSDSITAIGPFCFQGLPITQLYLPGSVTAIGEQALAGCALRSVHLGGMVPPAAAANAFLGVDTCIPVFVPRMAVAAYQTAEVWQAFAHITPWYEVGDTITRRYPAGAYTSEYTLRYQVIDEGGVELLPPTYRIPDGLPAGMLDLTDTLAYRFVVTQLADGALRNCQELYSLHLGSQVTYLGDSVFLGCKQLSWIICDALTPPAASIATFDGVDLNTRVDVPAGAFAQYKVADGWRLFYCFNPLIINDEQPEGLPAVPSGTDEQTASAKVVKCFYRGDVLILRDGRLYDLLGRPIGSTK